MPGVEEFTILAVLEARDRAEAIIRRVEGAVNNFTGSAERAAEAATTAGAAIDESLLQTASGTDAAELAAAQLGAARTKLAMTTDAVANAERNLMEAQAAAADAATGDVAANARLTAALDELNAAQREQARASRDAAAAETRQSDVARAVAASDTEAAAAAEAQAAANARAAASAEASARAYTVMGKATKIAAVATAAIAVLSVKAAGDFQSSTQHLVTDAGEAQKNLGMVQKGILGIAVATGTTATNLTNSMYHIESSGYHGAAGLNILRVAAEGAKVGGADFDTVGKTLTGTMNSYGLAGDKAVSMMNQLIATTGAGDMRMQDLASSLGNVTPIAAAAGLQFAQVGGAMATMTAQNMSAQQAAQDLANTIRALSNPNNVAIKEMQNLGLNSNDLSKNLGTRGLTGTLDMLTKAVAAHTKGGQVLINTFNSSKQAAANADQMIKAMPPNLQKLAQGYLNGSTTLGAWRKELKDLPPVQAAMMAQFGTLANKTHSFNDLLKTGSPAAQTYNAAMAKLLGGATGLNTSLMITGGRMGEFKSATEKISEAAQKGGKHVEDWDKIQGTFNQKMDVLKASVGAAGIELGTVLLPAAQELASVLTDILGPTAQWIGQHQQLVGLIAAIAGGAAAAALGIKAWAVAQGILDTMMAIFAGEMQISGMALLIIGIAAVVAGLIYAYNHFDKFRAIVKATFAAVKIAAVDMWHALVAAWNGVVAAAMATWHALQTAWNAVVTAAMAVWHALVATWDAIAGATTTAWNAIKGFFAKWWPLLLVIFSLPIAILIGVWNHFHEQIISTAKTVWNAVKSFFEGMWHGIEAVAKLVWTGIKVAIISPLQAAWHTLEGIWNSIKPYLSGVWNGIESTAGAIWNGIKTAIITPLQSAWKTISSTMGQIASTIQSKLDDAWNAVSNIGSEFEQIGQYIVDGIVNGIESGAGAIASAAKHVASSALSGAKHLLGIGSPSKKFYEIGGWIVHGLINGLTAGTATVRSTTERLARELYDAFKGTGHKKLQQWIGHESSLLMTLAHKRDSIVSQLKSAQSRLKTLQADWVKERDQVAQNILGGASVVMQPTDQFTPLSAAQILDNYREQARAAQAFATDLQTLRKRGLSSAIIQQIAASGVDQGAATAAALATAGSSTIKALNQQQSAMQKAANTTGGAVADSMYKTGIDSAKGLIRGLQSKEKDIENQMLKIAKLMQSAIKKALGIKSPSSVMADEVGQHVPTGVAQGVYRNSFAATKAVTDLADGMVRAAGRSKQVIPALMGSVKGGTTGLPYMSTSTQAGGGMVYIDLRGTQVMTERDMDALVEKVGKRVATRILPAGGQKIRM